MPAYLEVNQVINNQVEDQRYAQFVDNLDKLDKTVMRHMLILIRTKKPITLLMNSYLNCYFVNEKIRLYLINFILYILFVDFYWCYDLICDKVNKII